MKCFLFLVILTGFAGFAQQKPPVTVSRIYDSQLSAVEKGVIGIIEAMPAEKMNFAPTQGEFKGARTFALQATHIAAVVYATSAIVLGEKSPSDMGPDGNGPASIRTKEEVLKHVKDAFAYAHRAMQTLTAENLTDAMPSPFGPGTMSRGGAASGAVWHSYDHYGQMAVYLRMNGIVPPASREQ